jgi:hypothetical protein
MSLDPKNPQQLPVPAQDSGATPRRKYTAPHVKLLGSVRDLTLGSPPNMFSDGIAFQRNKGM